MTLREFEQLLVGSNVVLMWKNSKGEVMNLLQPIYEINKLSEDLLDSEILRINVNGVKEEVGIFLKIERDVKVFNEVFHDTRGRLRIAKPMYEHVAPYEYI